MSNIYSDEHKIIINQLILARREKGLSQSDAAKLIGKTQSHLSKVEAGQRHIDIVELKKFAQIYNKNLDFFLK